MKRDETIFAETPRLIIRRFKESDLDDLSKLFGDPRVMQYMGEETFSREKSEEELKKYMQQFEERGWGLGAVIIRAYNTFAGRCGLMRWDLPEVQGHEITFALLPDFWGKGYATEAASAVRDYAFEELGMNRLISIVDKNNSASERVARKVHDGLEKEILFFGRETYVFATPLT